MNKDDTLYGLLDWEYLKHDPDEAVEEIVDQAVARVGEPFEITASHITWPLRIHVFKRRNIGGEGAVNDIARRVIEDTLERLEEEYGDWKSDKEPTPTPAMKAAALAFGRAVVAGYVPFMCEPTGEVIEYTRAQAAKLI